MKSAGSYVDIILEVYTEVYIINIHFYTLPLVGGVNTTTLPYTTPLGKTIGSYTSRLDTLLQQIDFSILRKRL